MSRVPDFNEGARRYQDHFGTRALADRLVERLARVVFTEDDRAFIDSRPLFFLATADARGAPDCSYKGGAPGFVRVVAPDRLAFPSYDGNGMFRSLGNVAVNPQVGLLFIDFEKPRRLRVNGEARASVDADVLATFPGAQVVVEVTAHAIFPNCPRYIHSPGAALSEYVPRAGHEPPVPRWKRFPQFREVLPPGDPGLALPPIEP